MSRAQRRRDAKRLPKGGCPTYVAPDPVRRLTMKLRRSG